MVSSQTKSINDKLTDAMLTNGRLTKVKLRKPTHAVCLDLFVCTTCEQSKRLKRSQE